MASQLQIFGFLLLVGYGVTYSLLRTTEDLFGVPHLADAALPTVPAFGSDVFSGFTLSDG